MRGRTGLACHHSSSGGDTMKMRRRCVLCATVALGLGVLGCQAPFSKTQATPRLDEPHPTAPAARNAEKSQASRPAARSVSEKQPSRKLRMGIQPPDSLPPCRPTSQQKPISVTRFLKNLEPKRSEVPAAKPADKASKQFQIPKVFPGAQDPPLKLPEIDPNCAVCGTPGEDRQNLPAVARDSRISLFAGQSGPRAD